jgi:hypothetical protein
MAHHTPDQIPGSRLPAAIQSPGKGDQCGWEVRRGDGEEAEEGYGRGGVPAGPEVDGDEGQGGGEEGEVEEGGEGLC